MVLKEAFFWVGVVFLCRVRSFLMSLNFERDRFLARNQTMRMDRTPPSLSV